MTFYEFVQFKTAERSDILNSTFDVGRSMLGVQIGIFLKSTALGVKPAPTRYVYGRNFSFWKDVVGAGLMPAHCIRLS